MRQILIYVTIIRESAHTVMGTATVMVLAVDMDTMVEDTITDDKGIEG